MNQKEEVRKALRRDSNGNFYPNSALRKIDRIVNHWEDYKKSVPKLKGTTSGRVTSRQREWDEVLRDYRRHPSDDHRIVKEELLHHAANHDYKDGLPLYPGKITFQSNEVRDTKTDDPLELSSKPYPVWDAHDKDDQRLLPRHCVECGRLYPTRQKMIECECKRR